MMLVIDTQYQENYGAHDWDGLGECPQRWKFKGGSEFKVTGIPRNVDVDRVLFMLGQEVQWSDNGSISTVWEPTLKAMTTSAGTRKARWSMMVPFSLQSPASVTSTFACWNWPRKPNTRNWPQT